MAPVVKVTRSRSRPFFANRGNSTRLIGFSRPDRTRPARSASRNRSGSTTKKIARPPAGRTFGGPTVVTSVPPARAPSSRAPSSRASCTAIDPTPPAAPCGAGGCG